MRSWSSLPLAGMRTSQSTSKATAPAWAPAAAIVQEDAI